MLTVLSCGFRKPDFSQHLNCSYSIFVLFNWKIIKIKLDDFGRNLTIDSVDDTDLCLRDAIRRRLRKENTGVYLGLKPFWTEIPRALRKKLKNIAFY